MNFLLKLTEKNFKFFRLIIILSNDLLIINISLFMSYLIRLEYFINILDIKNIFIISNLLYVFLFFIFKIYKQYFRYFNYNAFKIYLKFFSTFAVLFCIFVLIDRFNTFIPRSLIIIFPSLSFILIIINRRTFSYLFQYLSKLDLERTIVFGLNLSLSKTEINYSEIIYFIDDSISNQKRVFNGVKVISTKELLSVYKNLNFNKILILKEKYFAKCKIQLRKYILDNKILVQKININNNIINFIPYYDYNYILNRKSKIIKIGNEFKNKIIFITGAGGSIGTGIVLQLANLNFKKLILLDNSEYNLYKLSSLLENNKNFNKIDLLLFGFEDNERITNIFINNSVDIIFHAAAYKHVPLIEKNPFSAIQNNFVNTYNFIRICKKFEIPYFCLISSDKAVRPTNIMGASKRLAELSAMYLNNFDNKNTIINCVRFGNVINSSGSVLPLFQNQIDEGKNITLTHKNIIRYFMTIEEAANLVISSYNISKGGEIFLLDMGEQIKIENLAKLMIQFSGKKLKKNGKGDIEIKLIGLREGEKLYEELLVDKNSKATELDNIFISIEKKMRKNEFKELYNRILEAQKSNNVSRLSSVLRNKFINFKYEKI